VAHLPDRVDKCVRLGDRVLEPIADAARAIIQQLKRIALFRV
jgi:hypothetical protein